MPSCIIVSGGIINDYSFYKNRVSEQSYIICADGGIKHLLAMGLTPNLWLGDFDSCKFSQISEAYPNLKNVETITLNPQKDVTDTHYACIEAIKRGYNKITFWGACGGRADHMLSNIHLLEFLKSNGAEGIIADEKNTIRLCDGAVTITKERKYLSIIPIDSSAFISKTTGLKYPLKNYTLTREISMGVSNEITDAEATISVESGLILVVESDD